MRIPVTWLKEYIDVPENLKEFTDKMSMIGHLLDKQEVTETDTVIDLELRGNRADCYSILGIAREAYASFGGRFTIPEVIHLPSSPAHTFKVTVESDVVHRFYSIVIEGVSVSESPEWMKTRLRDYGIDPINNIVDITNYVMIESGMPLHAFDLDKISSGVLLLRSAKKGETFTTFDGSNLDLTTEDVVFTDGGTDVLGLVGIIGEKNSGISTGTKRVLLECAAYDRATIRKTMHRHKAMTDAGLRHSHDLSASFCDYALARAVTLVQELSPGVSLSGLNNYYPEPEQPQFIKYNPSETLRLGGVEVPSGEQKQILERLEFRAEIDEDTGSLLVTPPLFRTDILESADIVEEVLRIWGYEKIPSTTLSSVIPDPIVQPELVVEEKSKDIFTSLGMDEVLTVPMATEKSLSMTHDPHLPSAIGLVNPSSSEHTHMRTNMYTGLLDAVKRVTDRGDKKVSFFELGKVYFRKQTNFHQPPHKADFPYSEHRKVAGVFSSKLKDVDFFEVKGIVEEHLNQLRILDVKYTKIESPFYDLGCEVRQGEIVLGTLGKIASDIASKNFDIKYDVYGFELDVESLVKAQKTPVNYMPHSSFPSVKQDMSVLISNDTTSGEIYDSIKGFSELIRGVEITDVYTMNNERSILYSITYQAKERTLSTEEVNKLHQEIEESLKNRFGVVIRGRG